MQNIILPEVPEFGANNVMVPKEVWIQLLKYITLMQKTINAQAAVLEAHGGRLERSEENIKTLADALGGLYNANS